VLVAKWRAVPADIARRVRGGQPGTERNGEIYGEAIQEIDRGGRVVWEWLTFEHLDPEIDVIGPLHPRDRWTNLNSLSEMPDGNILVSFRCTNTIAIIERASGRITWRWGPGQVAGQHHPTALANGNILVFDNGAHRAYTTVDFSRVIEVEPKSGRIVWEYKENPVFDFSSFICSGAQRMPGGTTVICECTKGRLFEVTAEGDIVWEYVSPFYYEHPIFGTNNMVFRCVRYAPDYPGLQNRELDPGRYVDFNALVPRRFVRSPRSREALRTRYDTGAVPKGGH
jgi:hypothetical protein